MVNARPALHKCVWLAHLWRQAPHDNPYLCRARSTFPPMTTGTLSGILESIQAARTAPALRRKERKHEVNTIRMVASGSSRGTALRLLRCTPWAGAQFEPVVAAGIPAAARYQYRSESVPVLSPAPPGPSPRSCCQHSNLRTLEAISSYHRPASNSIIANNGEGHREALSLPHPSSQAWADGRRDQL
jgi:hypothetical protein